MKTALRTCVGVVGGAALALTAVATSTPAAHANPNWTLYNETTSAPLTSADQITGSGTASFAATIGGVLRNITCTFSPTSNPVSVTASGALSQPPGSKFSLSAAPPSSLTCYSGTIPVPVTLSGTWSVEFTSPAAGTAPGQLYNGTLTGSLEVPLNSIVADLSGICAATTATGPTTASAGKTTKSFLGSYNAANGAVTANANQTFTVSSSGCSVLNPRLTSASITLNPIIDLQW